VTLRDLIDFPSIRVLDGGLATELERRGCDISGPLWSAHVLDQSPATIAAVHLDYLRAGADCIATASYQVSAHGYRELGLYSNDDPAAATLAAVRALRNSVEIADQTRAQYAQENSRRVWIAASLEQARLDELAGDPREHRRVHALDLRHLAEAERSQPHDREQHRGLRRRQLRAGARRPLQRAHPARRLLSRSPRLHAVPLPQHRAALAVPALSRLEHLRRGANRASAGHPGGRGLEESGNLVIG